MQFARNKKNPGKGGSRQQPPTPLPASQPVAGVMSQAEVVLSVFPGTGERMRRLWERALPEGVTVCVLEEPDPRRALAEAVANLEVADRFIFVGANTFPTHSISLEELRMPLVYVRKDGSRSYCHALPTTMDKAAVVEIVTDESFDDVSDEAMFESLVPEGKLPIEVGFSFGNFVTPVLRGNPCEHVVIEAFLRKKYIHASSEGWQAIEALIDKFLSE